MDFQSNVGISEDRYKPSFFELAAQDQLRDLLAPVTRYVLSVFAQSHPRYLLKIINHHDEYFALLMFFVERYYLKNWGASFAEHFYSLKRRRRVEGHPIRTRVQSNPGDDPERLSSNQIRWSLVCLVGIPYLRSKARDLYESLGGGTDPSLLEDNPRPSPRVQQIGTSTGPIQRFTRKLLVVYKCLYPYANATYELSNLLYSLRYLFDQSPFWRLFDAWLNLDIRLLSGEDHQRMREQIESKSKSPFRRNPVNHTRPSLLKVTLRLIQLGKNYMLESLKVALPASIFFFKLLEWWYSSSNIRRFRHFGNPDQDSSLLIKPPASLSPHPDGVLSQNGKPAPVKKGHCPICRSALVNSTAFPSGWVCCYKCAHSHVTEFGRCPVTWYPTMLADLRKIVG